MISYTPNGPIFSKKKKNPNILLSCSLVFTPKIVHKQKKCPDMTGWNSAKHAEIQCRQTNKREKNFHERVKSF